MVGEEQAGQEAVAEAGAPKVNHLKEQAKRGRRFLAAQAEAKAAADKDEVVTNGWGPGSLLEVSLVGGGIFVSSGDDYCVRDENGDLVIIKKLAVIPAFD